ncbi:hypothetical protein KVR01_011254 [Diaporthe batatas]|uniref:uncharacterized protein n=1 Tax=Diaporthe batatas TaxID=748121 RepID=UPI001D038597|nr:uncharacterized protein KVR01_011254 [Diaporthe batatas]KAG8158811.1 hypothetical protein KVR01_011254 [Diaporthe batatas]
MVLVETFALCKPVEYSWDKTIEGECAGENTAYLIAGIVNLVIDTFIVALPMPQVFRLQMTLTKRISVAGMFSLGALICIISLLRIIWLYTWDLSDLTYTVTPGAIHSAPARTPRKVKGNITRDFERLDDEYPLHEIRIESGRHPDNTDSLGSGNIQVARAFGVDSGEHGHRTQPGQFSTSMKPASESLRA